MLKNKIRLSHQVQDFIMQCATKGLKHKQLMTSELIKNQWLCSWLNHTNWSGTGLISRVQHAALSAICAEHVPQVIHKFHDISWYFMIVHVFSLMFMFMKLNLAVIHGTAVHFAQKWLIWNSAGQNLALTRLFLKIHLHNFKKNQQASVKPVNTL